MKKLLLGTLLFLALGFVAALVTLPEHYHFERRVVIAAEPGEVYGTIADLHTWPDWTVWNLQLDPEAVYDFPGRPAGDGARMTWDGPKLKQGQLALSDCEAPRHIGYELDLEQGRHVSSGSFELSATPAGTLVVWTNAGDLPGLSKLMGPLLDNLVAPQFERSLEGLKARLEATTGPAN